MLASRPFSPCAGCACRVSGSTCRRWTFTHRTLPSIFKDALGVAYMERYGITEILSYDADFDRVPGVRRVAP